MIVGLKEDQLKRISSRKDVDGNYMSAACGWWGPAVGGGCVGEEAGAESERRAAAAAGEYLALKFIQQTWLPCVLRPRGSGVPAWQALIKPDLVSGWAASR